MVFHPFLTKTYHSRAGDNMAEGFFRSKKGFTVVQNEITKDTRISLKAKGLYLVIQAYISMPDKKWTKDDFLRLAKEGTKAFDSAWKELKETGYLKVHIMSDNGRWRTEYELLDEPVSGPHTLYHNSDGEITSDNIRRAEKSNQGSKKKAISDHYPQNGSNGKNGENPAVDHCPPFGSNGNGSNGNGANANGGNNNKNYNINPDIKTNIINPYPNQYQYQEEDVMGEDYPMEFVEEHYGLAEGVQDSVSEKQLETVKDVLYDALNTKKATIRVMGEEKPAMVVKSRLLKLDRLDIDYAIEQYKKQVTKVHNHKAYMLTVLYLARSQGELDISNQVMYDFYGAGREEHIRGGGDKKDG